MPRKTSKKRRRSSKDAPPERAAKKKKKTTTAKKRPAGEKKPAAKTTREPAPARRDDDDSDELDLDGLDEDGSPIEAAIDAALAESLGDRPPDRDYGTILSWDEGGPDPVDRISAFAVDAPRRHWLLVTYGLTERLFDRATGPEAPDGVELTARVAREPRDREPPAWALALLQGLVRHVCREGGAPPSTGRVRAPLSLQGAPWLGAVAFRQDPDLAPRRTSWGRLSFLQVVHLGLDELALAERWSLGHVVAALVALDPTLSIDPARPSLLADPAGRAALEARAAAGAAAGAGDARLALERLDVRSPRGRLVLTIDAGEAPALARALDERTARGASLVVAGPGATLAVVPVDPEEGRGALRVEADGGLALHLPPALALELARDLAAHAPGAGRGPGRGEARRLQWPELPGVTVILATGPPPADAAAPPRYLPRA